MFSRNLFLVVRILVSLIVAFAMTMLVANLSEVLNFIYANVEQIFFLLKMKFLYIRRYTLREKIKVTLKNIRDL